MMSDVYAYHLGEKQAWKAVQQARLFSSDEALEIGLVDESVEVEEVLGRAEKHLKKVMGVYLPVYAKSKEYFRKALLKLVDRPIEPMIETIAEGYDDPFVKQSMSMFLMSLKK